MELVHKFRASPKLFSSVDANALAGILMVLLFVMMVPYDSSDYKRISVDLPKASHPSAMPGALREDAMMVAVTRDGRVYFGSDQINASNLRIKIQDYLKDPQVERKGLCQGGHARALGRGQVGARWSAQCGNRQS